MLTNQHNNQPELSQGESSRKSKRISLPPDSRLNQKIIERLEHFLEFVPPEQFSRNLRNLFLFYLDFEKDGLSRDMEGLPVDLYFLFELLDTAADEMKEAG